MSTNHGLKDEIAAYWAARAPSFDASPGHGIAPGPERAAWLALVHDTIGPLHGNHVLELASGTGEFTGILLDAGARVTGLDLCDAMLAHARRKLARAGRRVALYLGDAEDTREPAAAFDAVICRHLVWTLADPERALAEWFRVLRPGGRVLIIDGDWVRLPWVGRLRHAMGAALIRLLGRPSEFIDWPAHERIMAQVHFRQGLRAEPLAAMLHQAGFAQVQTGSLKAIRRHQRRAAGFPRSWTIGVYREFWMQAAKP